MTTSNSYISFHKLQPDATKTTTSLKSKWDNLVLWYLKQGPVVINLLLLSFLCGQTSSDGVIAGGFRMTNGVVK